MDIKLDNILVTCVAEPSLALVADGTAVIANMMSVPSVVLLFQDQCLIRIQFLVHILCRIHIQFQILILIQFLVQCQILTQFLVQTHILTQCQAQYLILILFQIHGLRLLPAQRAQVDICCMTRIQAWAI